MPEITLDEFCDQWVRGKWTTVMASKLAGNVFDFATAAGEYSRNEFRSSFSTGGFCGGTPWAPRTSRWGKRYTYPVLMDSGELSRSIKGEADKINIEGRSDDGTRISRHGAKYSIWTTEKSVSDPPKRGKNTERYGHYAAVHNTDPKFGLFTVNQYSSRRPVHRQFIGFNQSIDDYINTHFIDMIFEGFPK